MDQDLAAGKGREPVEHAAGAALGEMAHFASGFSGRAAIGKFLVVPQGPVDQQTVRTLRFGDDAIGPLAESRRVEATATTRLVDEDDADRVVRRGVMSPGGIGRGFAGKCNRHEPDARNFGDLEGGTTDRIDGSPIHAAIMFEYAQQRVTRREVAVHARCAIHGESTGVFTQCHQSGRMVDLGIDE